MYTLYLFIFIFRRLCRNNCNQVSHAPERIPCLAMDFISMNPCFLTRKRNQSWKENPPNELFFWEGFCCPTSVGCALLISWFGTLWKSTAAKLWFSIFPDWTACKSFYNIITDSLICSLDRELTAAIIHVDTLGHFCGHISMVMKHDFYSVNHFDLGECMIILSTFFKTETNICPELQEDYMCADNLV